MIAEAPCTRAWTLSTAVPRLVAPCRAAPACGFSQTAARSSQPLSAGRCNGRVADGCVAFSLWLPSGCGPSLFIHGKDGCVLGLGLRCPRRARVLLWRGHCLPLSFSSWARMAGGSWSTNISVEAPVARSTFVTRGTATSSASSAGRCTTPLGAYFAINASRDMWQTSWHGMCQHQAPKCGNREAGCYLESWRLCHADICQHLSVLEPGHNHVSLGI